MGWLRRMWRLAWCRVLHRRASTRLVACSADYFVSACEWCGTVRAVMTIDAAAVDLDA